MALAAGIDFHNFDLDVAGIDTDFTSVSPFVSFSTRLGQSTRLHMGARYSYFSNSINIEEAKAVGTSKGTSAFFGVEQSISNKTKFLAEAGYDLTFNGFRFGSAFLFGWKSFRLKLGVNYFKPEGTGNFIWPSIGLCWRFDS